MTKNYLLIEPLISDPKLLLGKGRGTAISNLALISKRQKSEIYKLLSQFWQRGQTPNALLPLYFHADGTLRESASAGKKRGPKGSAGISIGPNERHKLRLGVEEFILKKKETRHDAYLSTMGKYWHSGYEYKQGSLVPILLPEDERPTERQFLYVYEKHLASDPERFKKARLGEHRYKLKGRKIVGELTQQISGAGIRFIVDGTHADTELVGETHRRPIGSPDIFVVIDALTHTIVGVHITLENQSYLSAALALENAFTEKCAFAAGFDVDIKSSDWPCHHVPHSVQADRGELIHPIADTLFKALGTRIDTIPARRPDWKGVIERLMRTLNQRLLHRLPGAKTPRSRGDKDPKLTAALTLREFTKLVILSIIDVNKHWMDGYKLGKRMISDEVRPIPLELWNWSMRSGTSSLREFAPEFIRANLLPRDNATVDRSGILRGDVCYTFPEDFAFNRYATGTSGNKTLSIAYDPRTLNEIFLRRIPNGELVRCSLHPRDARFENWTWREHREWKKALAAAQRESKAAEEQRRIETNEQIKEVALAAKNKTKEKRTPGASKTSIVSGVDDRRAIEQLLERKERTELDKCRFDESDVAIPAQAPKAEGSGPASITSERLKAIATINVTAEQLRGIRNNKRNKE